MTSVHSEDNDILDPSTKDIQINILKGVTPSQDQLFKSSISTEYLASVNQDDFDSPDKYKNVTSDIENGIEYCESVTTLVKNSVPVVPSDLQ